MTDLLFFDDDNLFITGPVEIIRSIEVVKSVQRRQSPPVVEGDIGNAGYRIEHMNMSLPKLT